MEYTIVLGWYKRGIRKVTELKISILTMEEVSIEKLKEMAAYRLGRLYPDDIDFRYFDVSMKEV